MASGEIERAGTGIAGLDDILGGGLPIDRLYLVQGTPGVGKTTLAMQFLIEGVRRGESVLYITLSETESEIRQVAASHDWSLDGVALYELSTAEQSTRLEDENTLYATQDIELKETIRVLLQEVERVKPKRVVFDSLSEIRLLAQTAARYRRQLLGLKQYFAEHECTVLLLDDKTGETGDLQVESLAHGVIVLEQNALEYGADRRRVRVTKLRGARFRSGHHDFVIRTGGLDVFPRLVAAEHRTGYSTEILKSGNAGLDELLGGGLDHGSATLVMGPAGVGKSAIAALFACSAATTGDRAALFLFEERAATLALRAESLRVPIQPHIDSGAISVQQIDPAELAPDEFTHAVRAAVDAGARVIVIDSINGYFHAMPEARSLVLQLHELFSFLASRGVATVVTLTQSGMMGTMTAPVDVSYLSDAIVMLRYFEAAGRVRKAIGVVKKRTGSHEDTLRELILDARGITVGAPLSGFRGILTGVPTYEGAAGALDAKRQAGDA